MPPGDHAGKGIDSFGHFLSFPRHLTECLEARLEVLDQKPASFFRKRELWSHQETPLICREYAFPIADRKI